MKVHYTFGFLLSQTGAGVLVSVVWVCVWQIHETFIQVVLNVPTTLRAVERTTATCIHVALLKQLWVPTSIRELFCGVCVFSHECR